MYVVVKHIRTASKGQTKRTHMSSTRHGTINNLLLRKRDGSAMYAARHTRELMFVQDVFLAEVTPAFLTDDDR